AVVVCGVVEHFRRIPSGDDAACAAIARTGRRYRVLTVEAAWFAGKQALAILEGAAVLAVGEGAAAPDECEGLDRFGRQPCVRGQGRLGAGLWRAAEQRTQQRTQQ